jgi:hypothetical protein
MAAIPILLMQFLLSGKEGKAESDKMPGVEQILERYVEAIGGREAIEKLSTRICTGSVITDLSSREHPIYESGYFEAYSKVPSSYYTKTWSDQGNYIRAYDGNEGWIQDKCGVKPDSSAGKRRLDWLLNPQNALRIKEYFPDLKLKGTLAVRGFEVYVLETPALHRPLFFDIESGLLIGFGHNWEIHDYREADGVLFPHRILLSRKGGSTVYEFETVEHNRKINDSLFSMPEGKN